MKNSIYLCLAVILAVSTAQALTTTEASMETFSFEETIHGTFWANADNNDQDWCAFEIISDTEVTISGSALMSGGCDVDPGSLTPVQTPICLDPIEGTAIIEATENNPPTVPTGYQTLYLLSQGSELLILNVATAPSFEINEAGTYRIHTLVYSPGTYDTDDINFGLTTAADIAENFLQGRWQNMRCHRCSWYTIRSRGLSLRSRCRNTFSNRDTCVSGLTPLRVTRRGL